MKTNPVTSFFLFFFKMPNLISRIDSPFELIPFKSTSTKLSIHQDPDIPHLQDNKKSRGMLTGIQCVSLSEHSSLPTAHRHVLNEACPYMTWFAASLLVHDPVVMPLNTEMSWKI